MKLALAACLLLGVAYAQPWRYTDDKGQVHWTNDPYQLPPTLRARVLARREAARSKKAKRAKKKAEPSKGAPVAAPAQQAPAAPTSLNEDVFSTPKSRRKRRAAPREPAKAAVDWAGRIRAAEAEVAKAKAKAETTNTELTKARVQLATVVSGPAYARRNTAVKADTAAKSAVAAAEAELARVKEEARRAGYLR